MAKHTVKATARYQLRGDTAAALEAVNPTFKYKEPILVYNENGAAYAFKIGDGVTPYTNLPLHIFSEKGEKGDDYVLTEADKTEIAQIVLSLLPNGDEVAY